MIQSHHIAALLASERQRDLVAIGRTRPWRLMVLLARMTRRSVAAREAQPAGVRAAGNPVARRQLAEWRVGGGRRQLGRTPAARARQRWGG